MQPWASTVIITAEHASGYTAAVIWQDSIGHIDKSWKHTAMHTSWNIWMVQSMFFSWQTSTTGIGGPHQRREKIDKASLWQPWFVSPLGFQVRLFYFHVIPHLVTQLTFFSS